MTSTATFTNAASIRAASTGWAGSVRVADRRDGAMSSSMRRRVRLVQGARTRRAKRPVTACKSDGRPAQPPADPGRRCRDFGSHVHIKIHASKRVARVAAFGPLGEREMLTWEDRRRRQRGWQDKASSSLAGPMALSCCLHIGFWALSQPERGRCAARFGTFSNEFNALSCHAVPQPGSSLRHRLFLHATLR